MIPRIAIRHSPFLAKVVNATVSVVSHIARYVHQHRRFQMHRVPPLAKRIYSRQIVVTH